MTEFLEQEIRTLRSLFWSARDPDGRGFAPLADACRRAGDSRQAIELLDDGIGRHPEFAPGHVVAARLYMDLAFFEEAERAARKALDLDVENVEALRSLAVALEGKGAEDEAVEVRGRLSVLEPKVETAAEAVAEAGETAAAEEEIAVEEEAVAEAEEDAAEESVLDASAFGEADHGDRETLEYVEPGEEMEEVDVGLIDLTLGEEPEEDEPVDEEEVEEEPVVDLAALAPDEPEEPVVELAALAPDEPDDLVLDVAALAPDEPEDLVLDVAALAPDEPEAVDDAGSGMVGDMLSEEAADAPLEEFNEAPIQTRTIAELYVTQGAMARAVEVYKSLIEANPGDSELVARLADLETRVAAEGRQDVEGGAPRVSLDEDEEEVESLARDLAKGGDHTQHEVDTPFAWAEAEPAETESDAPPVGDYFSRLLGWEPAGEAAPDDDQDVT